MKKSAFLIASTLILVSLILGACAPSTTPAEEPEIVTVKETVEVLVTPVPAPEEPVTITFWHTYTEVSPENEMLDTLISIFEEQNPNIKVEPLNVPWEDFRTKLFT
ncbi:MAG: ABC transporter substrate-binding protein, partial [Dehalococcoidia bacterium]